MVELIPGRKTTNRKSTLFECSICGHQWRSYSKGERVFCPACYEREHGRRPGASDEALAKARAARMAKREAAALAAANSKPTEPQRIDHIPLPGADDVRQTSILDRIMNAKMFWAEGE